MHNFTTADDSGSIIPIQAEILRLIDTPLGRVDPVGAISVSTEHDPGESALIFGVIVREQLVTKTDSGRWLLTAAGKQKRRIKDVKN